MAPKYATMKNAELEALLKERGLPHTGKKAEMVARLEENDSKKNEDEIDWDDDAADVPTEAAKFDEPAATVATGIEETPAEQSKTEDLAVKEPATAPDAEGAEPAKEETPKVDYSIGIASTDVEKELEARRKRLERFNMKPEDMDDAAVDAQKRLERQKKFGDAATETDKLDSALSEKRKRGREGADDRGDFKRGRGRGGRFRGGPRRGGSFRGPGGPRNQRSESGGGGSSWMSAEDRAAAEKRKARWG